MKFARAATLVLAACAAGLAAPALADVKAGVDAWTKGDYARAVAEWKGPAAAGDADAQFNLAQAYRLGRGVEANAKQAEIYYAKAAAQGHLKAADNYGLLLFQDGKREEAMPYISAAAGRGDPRAEYLLGIAHFNGDLMPRDWVRAYALLTLANSAGLPQAKPALQQMDTYIPLAQRQEAQGLAAKLKKEADAKRASQMAAADLNPGGAASTTAPDIAAARPAARPSSPLPSAATQAPRPIATTPVPPSVAAAQTAVAEAQRVTGTGSPASAGADYTGTSAPPSPAVSRPRPGRVAGVTTDAQAAASRTARQPAPQPAPTPAAGSGPWKVQLGAFSVAANADRMWSQLSGRSELAGATKLVVPSGRLTRLLAGGFSSRDAAQAACNALKKSGQSCLVTR